MKNFIKGLWITCGTLCIVLGVFGIFLPLLPTTPFLLLAAFCYARSSRRCYDWLLNNRWFGEYIKNYQAGHRIPWREKQFTFLTLWLLTGMTTIMTTIWFVQMWWGR